MDLKKINSEVTHGNFQLERVLKELARDNGLVPLGDVYVVMPTTHANYVDFVKNHDKTYTSGLGLVQTSLTTLLENSNFPANSLVIVAEGYTETITGAAGLSLDTAGTTIIGVGRGTDRPNLLMDGAATVDVGVSADDIMLKNFIFEAGHADVATLFEVAAAKNFHIIDVEAIDNTSGENFVRFVRTNTTDNAADGLTIKDCKFVTPDTGASAWLLLQGDIDSLVVHDNYINTGVNATDIGIIVQATGKDMTNVSILRNHAVRLNTEGDLFIDNDTTANSGIVANNYMLHADTAGEVLIDADGVGLFENKATAVVTASGYLLPVEDS